MRILLYTRPAFFDTTLPLVRALSQRGAVHLVLELAPESQRAGMIDLDLDALPRGLQRADPVLRKEFPPGVQEYWRDVASFHLLVHHCRRSIHPITWFTSRELMHLARHVHPDVLHLEGTSLRLIGALPDAGRMPTILRIHDPEMHSGETTWRHSASWYLSRRHVDRFVLFSECFLPPFLAKNRFATSRTDIARLGPLEFFREWLASTGEHSPHERGIDVLFFGRFSPYKGIDVLLEALPAVAARVPGLRVVLAGQPITGYTLPDPPRLPNQGEIEIIARYIPNETLAALFDCATLVVCPYRHATQSGVVMDAYGMGVPVVATSTGGLPEYITDGETGLLVAPGDAGQLADAITRILTDASVREHLRSGVASLTRGTDPWDAIADTMMVSYTRTIATAHNSATPDR